MTRDKKFDWMNEAIYEPEPVQYTSQRARVTLGVFAWLCVLAAVCGVLWAVSN